jgi:hypothetical protein
MNRPFGMPCVTRNDRRLRNSPAQGDLRGLRQSSPKPPVASALLGGSEGGLPGKEGRLAGVPKFHSVKCAQMHRLFVPLCRAEQFGALAGFRRGLFEGRACFSARTSSAGAASAAGSAGSKRHWGALLFGYLLLGKQEKVTSRRATPGLQTLKTWKR